MAYKMILSAPYNGMSHIWNVSNNVGDGTNSINEATDVDLVKILLAEWIRLEQPPIHQSCRQTFAINGQMDINTAFWIRVANIGNNPSMTGLQQGKIDPARSSSFGSQTWTIVLLNLALKNRAPRVWNDLPNRATSNPALTAALQRTTP